MLQLYIDRMIDFNNRDDDEHSNSKEIVYSEEEFISNYQVNISELSVKVKDNA